MRRRTAALAALVLVAACSSGDDAAPDTTLAPQVTGSVTTDPQTTTPPPTASSAPTTAPGTSPTTAPPSTNDPTATTDPTDPARPLTESELADQESAATALLTLADFPDGWAEEPVADADDDPAADEFEEDFDACLGRDPDQRLGEELDRIAAQTGDFHPAEDDTLDVSHEVALAVDDETATARMADVDVSGSEDCVAAVLVDFYASLSETDPDLADLDIGDIVVTRTENEFDADVRLGVLIEIPLSIAGQDFSQFLEFVYQREGRALSELTFSSFGQPFDRNGYTELTGVVGERLATIG